MTNHIGKPQGSQLPGSALLLHDLSIAGAELKQIAARRSDLLTLLCGLPLLLLAARSWVGDLPEDRWRLSLECTNCLNESFIQSALSNYSYLNPPMSWIARARFNF